LRTLFAITAPRATSTTSSSSFFTIFLQGTRLVGSVAGERPGRMRPRHNRDWGFETNCFLCEPANAIGADLTDRDATFLP
jgi:hypothetical protein